VAESCPRYSSDRGAKKIGGVVTAEQVLRPQPRTVRDIRSQTGLTFVCTVSA
jgi:hypothetical protein